MGTNDIPTVSDSTSVSDGNGGKSPEWMLPTEAMNRFRFSEGAALDQSDSQPRMDVRYGFRVSSLNLMIKPRTVSEVIPMMEVTRIPNSPPWLLGMINLRSNLVPVFDLAMICALEKERTDKKSWILVFDKGDLVVGLVINSYPQPLSEMTKLQHIPSVPTALRSAVSGGYMLNDELWFEFDHKAFFSALRGPDEE